MRLLRCVVSLSGQVGSGRALSGVSLTERGSVVADTHQNLFCINNLARGKKMARYTRSAPHTVSQHISHNSRKNDPNKKI